MKFPVFIPSRELNRPIRKFSPRSGNPAVVRYFGSCLPTNAYLVAHHATDADAAGLRQGFESSGDVDAVAENVAPIDLGGVRS